MWVDGPLVKSVELEPYEGHCAGRIVAAVERCEPVRNEVEREQSAGAERQMLGDAEVAHDADRELPNTIGRSVLDIAEQLAIFRDLAAAEDGPGPVLQGRFGDEGVVAEGLAMPVDGLPTPCERSGELPAPGHLASIKQTCRP